MINANELRIGNIVTDGVVSPIEVIHMLKDGVAGKYVQKEEDRGMFPMRYDMLSPVPLTDGWLLKFGFALHTGDQSYERDIIAVLQTHEDRFIVGYKHTDAGWQYLKLTGFSYVHQLQNLYFALTQTELKPTK